MRPQVPIIGVGPAGSDRFDGTVEHAHRLDIRSQSSVETVLVDF